MIWLRWLVVGFFSFTAVTLMVFQCIEIFEAVISMIHQHFDQKK